MSRVNIILNDFEGDLKGDVIGVDYGAWVCIQKRVKMKLACGDFDSVSKMQFNEIKLNVKDLHELSPQKDMTDFSYALSLCDDYDEIFVYGGLGGRRDHEYIHVMTVVQDSRIRLFNNQNLIYLIESGNHIVEKKYYDYISFFVVKPGVLSLMGFKYPLINYHTQYFDSHMTSNEIVEKKGEIELKEGSLLVIQTKSSNH